MFSKLNSYLKKSRWLRGALIILGVFLLGGYFIWGIFGNFGFLLKKATPFPINLHSATQANYQVDPDYMQIPAMDIQLVIDAIWDQNQNVQDLSLQLTQVNENFIAQVSTITPRPSATHTPEIIQESVTETLLPGTDLSSTATASITPVGFVASATSTGEIVPPTETSIDPTYTGIPQTNTLIPPTNTPLPPTNTVSVCGQLSAGGFTNSGTKKATWSLTNNGPSSLSVTSITISWPLENGILLRIKFGSDNAWLGSAAPTTKSINGNWPIGGSSSKDLVFAFDTDALASGYNLSLSYGSGCTLNKSK